jgi:predicted amidohydrolase YtcJ
VAAGDAIAALPPHLLEVEAGVIRSARLCDTAPRRAHGGPGTFLLPALSDAHVHLVAAASERCHGSFADEHPADLRGLASSLGAAAEVGGWLRLRGFEETRLAEGRMPTRAELDAWEGARPLRIRHASRHASLLNSKALEAVAARGVDTSGVDDALLVGQEAALAKALPRISEEELVVALRAFGAELLSLGVLTLDELTATNDAERIELLEVAALPQQIHLWLGAEADPVAARRAARRVKVAGVKLLPRTVDEVFAGGFAEAVARARRAGLPVAIHAVEADALAAILKVLESAPPRAAGGPRGLDRIEHASLCPPELVTRIAAARLAVVTQPGFLVTRGTRYRTEVEEVLHPWLYPVASWLRAGIPVAFSSDAPVSPPGAAAAFAGACARGAGAGPAIGALEAISPGLAFAAQYESAARIRGDVPAQAWWQAGAPARFSVLGADPRPSAFGELDLRAVVLAGEETRAARA